MSMSYSAYVSSTSFALVEPIEDSATAIRSLVHQEMDGYRIDLQEEVNGGWTISMLDMHEVGDSFQGRIEKLVEAISPYVACAFEVTIRNCDTASDDRDSMFVGGPSPGAIEKFKRDLKISRAVDLLKQAGVDSSVIDLIQGGGRSESARVMVVMEGGCLQEIVSTHPISAYVVEYLGTNEGEKNVVHIPQGDSGQFARAGVSRVTVDVSPKNAVWPVIADDSTWGDCSDSVVLMNPDRQRG